MLEPTSEENEKLKRIPIKNIVEELPISPGVYLMKDVKGTIVYVGKAQNLRTRVRSYFTQSGDQRRFVSLLERLVFDIETIVTNTEKEALLLENTLIKRHKPRFNVKLVDDKNYLVLRLNAKADYPRLEVVRHIQKDGARYFGPYHLASSCRQTLQVVNRHFRLRTCTDQVMKQRTRPCLQYQIKRCDAPCVLPVPKEVYAEQVRDVSLFLEGKDEELVKRLKQRMTEAALQTEYEIAGTLRDQIRSLEKTLEEQRVVSTRFIDQDVFGLYREADQLTIAILYIRQGKLMGRRVHHFRDQEFPDTEGLSAFVGLYYDQGPLIPDEILLPIEIEDRQAKEEWLHEQGSDGSSRKKGTILVPMRGPKSKLVDLATKNAAAAHVSRRSQHKDTDQVLAKLQNRLGLQRLPRRIECFDISHLQGTNTVASRVVFVDGEPAKSEYRSYKIQSRNNDDFGSMYEVISRRLHRAKNQEEHATEKDQEKDTWRLPDLLVVDGGKGQLSSALAAVKDVGMDTSNMDIIGLAKERDDASLEKQPDRVFLPKTKDPIRLRPNTLELFILSRIRDEAHRFAVTFHKGQRAKQTVRSCLSDIPSIGKVRQMKLLAAFGSVQKMANATINEIAAVPGMNQKAAQAVIDALGSSSLGKPSQQAPSATSDVFENAAEHELEIIEDLLFESEDDLSKT